MNAQTETIRKLNDAARKGTAPMVRVFTPGVNALDRYTRSLLLARIRNFNEFHSGNDPHGEHDFGSVEYEGRKVFWKIDYYDKATFPASNGSENPADPDVTERVMTVMLAEEY